MIRSDITTALFSPSGRTREATARPVTRWLRNSLAVIIGASLSVTALLVVRGQPLRASLGHTVIGRAAALAGNVHYDSWRPLLKADATLVANPKASPYAVFFTGEGKFQYPPIALLAARALPQDVRAEAASGWQGSRLQRWSTWACRAALALTLACSVLALQRAMQRAGVANEAPRGQLGIAALTIAAGIFYFPHLIGYQLGQVQLGLNALLAGAVLLFFAGCRGIAGACIGLCCLIKPHYALMLVWAGVRRDGRFLTGALAVALPAVLTSLAVFGWRIHADYLAVLGVLARKSEVFWFNQSLPGVLHRLVDPGAANIYDHIGSKLPDYVAWIHWVGLLAALGVLAVALAMPQGLRAPLAARRADFGVMLMASTIASPVVWNHHYGVCFPLMMALLPELLHSPAAGRGLRLMFAAAFPALAFVLFAPDVLLRSAASGLLLSHTYFGGVLLFVVLCVWRNRLAAWPARAMKPTADNS